MSCLRLLQAAPPEENAVALLRAAARDHVPVDPSNKASLVAVSVSQSGLRIVPESKDRPSIKSVLESVREQEWYIGQIVYSRTVDAKEGQIGKIRL